MYKKIIIFVLLFGMFSCDEYLDIVPDQTQQIDLLFEKLDNTIKTEALSALLALGFGKKSAEEKLDKVLKENSEIVNVEELVKTALSQM